MTRNKELLKTYWKLLNARDKNTVYINDIKRGVWGKNAHKKLTKEEERQIDSYRLANRKINKELKEIYPLVRDGF